MLYNRRHIVDKDFIECRVDYALKLFNDFILLSETPLRHCNATVLHYKDYECDVYLLKSYATIVAMVDEAGDGIDFLRYVYGYTSTSAQHIRKFFDDYCDENADIYIYRP